MNELKNNTRVSIYVLELDINSLNQILEMVVGLEIQFSGRATS